MKKIWLLLVVCLAALTAGAQTWAPITWTAYGLTFDAPRGILVEEDTEETFLLNNSKFYITLQSLDSDDMKKEDLAGFLKDYANDDGVKNQTKAETFELKQFYGCLLQGDSDGDRCLYACLLTKDAGSGFYFSVLCAPERVKDAERILKSFKMEEE